MAGFACFHLLKINGATLGRQCRRSMQFSEKLHHYVGIFRAVGFMEVMKAAGLVIPNTRSVTKQAEGKGGGVTTGEHNYGIKEENASDPVNQASFSEAVKSELRTRGTALSHDEKTYQCRESSEGAVKEKNVTAAGVEKPEFGGRSETKQNNGHDGVPIERVPQGVPHPDQHAVIEKKPLHGSEFTDTLPKNPPIWN